MGRNAGKEVELSAEKENAGSVVFKTTEASRSTFD